MKIRTATLDDVAAMGAMLERLVAAGKRTAAADEEHVENPLGIRCTLAEDGDGNLLGFQSLIHAVEGKHYDTPVGWDHWHASVARSRRTGVGTKLFVASKEATIKAGLTKIEAFIGKDNSVAQALRADGFRDLSAYGSGGLRGLDTKLREDRPFEVAFTPRPLPLQLCASG
ncbi:GNAT family N-acetyltransferase [Rhizobium leguminosarum]|uniref:GCN5-related N-acetyltransferase protein (Modular protein) n=1 Tax=Rhizobium leguminosarum TaxID=384 RepID=A0A2K9Z2W4_RHILE|nr:GNAT family N-acetyltransferase [Rhizobium leguminosarum]AUW42609.1 Putative GCN5-related N-acetyltransferase protein (modular protein) [Rhizobium leguminosarum]